MQKVLSILFMTLVVIACNNDPRSKIPTTGSFGETISEDSAMNVADVVNLLQIQNNVQVKVQGTVTQYCKGEGCWLMLKNPDGEDLLVQIKDNAFVLPRKIEDKTVIAQGIATKETKDKKDEYSVQATGLIIK